MKNIEVDNEKIREGQVEANVVLDHYIMSGWIVGCQECGTWLTSLGLCTECGIRYELVRVGSQAVEQSVQRTGLTAADITAIQEVVGRSLLVHQLRQPRR